MALKIGITGGIGSGKSLVCKVFKLLGAPVFEADKVARKIMDSHPAVREQLTAFFGGGIYTNKGTLDRKKLAAFVFNDEVQLAKVNALVHPLVRGEFLKWASLQNSPYAIHEAAILFESGFYGLMDYNILVSAPKEMRVAWVAKRDNLAHEAVEARINKQWDDSKKRKLADLELVNDNTSLLLPEIIKIDKRLRKNGKIW